MERIDVVKVLEELALANLGEVKFKSWEALTLAISTLQSILSYEGKGMPEKKEHEQDCQYGQTGVCDCLSAYYYNQAIDDCKLWLQARMPSVEEIADTIMKTSKISILNYKNVYQDFENISIAISALLKERLGER